MTLAPGTELGGFRLGGVAARSGWSVVYRATELASGRPAAVKAIAPELAAHAGFRERFRRECEIAAAVEHPNLVPVLAAGEGWLATAWVEGRRLRERLPLHPPRAARSAAQVAGALDALHAAGFVHRDVKPGNVLVSGDGHAYLSDLGTAKPIDSDPGLTPEGRWLGHVDYAAPEQIRGEPPDGRSDVYALGATLFHSVTGRVPYPHRDDAAKMRAHLDEPAPGHDSELDPVVRRAMAKDPAERFPSAGELGAAALSATRD